MCHSSMQLQFRHFVCRRRMADWQWIEVSWSCSLSTLSFQKHISGRANSFHVCAGYVWDCNLQAEFQVRRHSRTFPHCRTLNTGAPCPFIQLAFRQTRAIDWPKRIHLKCNSRMKKDKIIWRRDIRPHETSIWRQASPFAKACTSQSMRNDTFNIRVFCDQFYAE